MADLVWTLILSVVAAAGIAYCLLALSQVLLFRAPEPADDGGPRPAVSILKPLCGAEPRLYECLRSFCELDYPVYQLVFGVRAGDDPAIRTVERLRAEYPGRDIALVVDARIHGANLKVSNLINMMAACRHGVLVIADSDVEVTPDALAAVVAPLADPSVGAVSTLYRGVATGGMFSTLGALYINDWFLPSVLVDERLNGVDGLFGAMISVRRSALEEVGGFEALKDCLADDNRLGRLLRERGWAIRLSRHTVGTMVGETSAASLFSHETRWARTVRACRAADHVLSVVTFPLPLVLALLALAPSALGAGLALTLYGLRVALHYAVHARLAVGGAPVPLLLPLREALNMAVWTASLFGNRVRWRERSYVVTAKGDLCPATDRPVQWPAWKPLALVLGTAAVDWLTPAEVEILALYAAVVAVNAKQGGIRNGSLAALLSLASVAIQGVFQGNPYTAPEFFALALLNKAVILFAIAHVCASDQGLPEFLAGPWRAWSAGKVKA
jgi:ceramide glucosyltransferase